MKKLIAKTCAGMEYIYNLHDTYQANQKKIDIICNAMNKAAYKLKTGELYHVYQVSEQEYKQAAYKLVNRQNKLIVYEVWSIFH